jgi:hypothetical protein
MRPVRGPMVGLVAASCLPPMYAAPGCIDD